MSITYGLAVYFIIWWIVLFAALPFGSKRTQVEAGEVAPGTEPGAPERPRFLRVIVLTTVIATSLFALYWWARDSGFSLDDIPFLQPPSHSYATPS